jgi:hypothetical protein
MAPEQLLEARFLESGDTYALGVTLFESAGATTAVRRPGCARSCWPRILAAPIPNVSELVPGVPKAFDPGTAACTAKQPHERYQSAREFRDELTRIARDSGGPLQGRVSSQAGSYERHSTRDDGCVVLVFYCLSDTPRRRRSMALGRPASSSRRAGIPCIYWGFAAMAAPFILMMIVTLLRVSAASSRADCCTGGVPPIQRPAPRS